MFVLMYMTPVVQNIKLRLSVYNQKRKYSEPFMHSIAKCSKNCISAKIRYIFR